MSRLFKSGEKLRNGEIEIIDQLGVGGLGEVYRVAMDRDGQRQIMAMKCFNPKLLEQSNLEGIEMVHKESLAVSKIKHSGIVSIVLVEHNPPIPYIIEEYFPGGDLLQAIGDRRRNSPPGQQVFSAEEIACLGFQISSALVMVHQNNLYHGDLKPQNICFRNKEKLETVLVDFGHAGFLEGNLLDRNGNLATLAYLPPERTGFVKLAGNASSDLYSLGATLHECVLGNPLFAGQDGGDLINRLLYEVPKALPEIFPEFPVALGDIISKLLRKDPSDRYHTAFGVAADFERCLQTLREHRELSSFALGTKDKLRELNYRIPMVGRQREMSELHSLLDKTHEGGQALALIGAPSGTGKSRLAFEILHKAKHQTSLISFVKFSEYERNLPLSAITLILVEHSQYLRGVSSENLIQWQKNLKLRLGARIQLIAERYSFYAPFLPATEPFRNTDSEHGFQVFNQTIGEFLSLLPAQNESQLLLIDDLQWADWQSLQILAVLGRKIINADAPRTMLMGTYRSNEIGEGHMLIPTFLDMRHDFSLIELGPLDQRDADTLVEHLLDESGPEVEKLQDLCYRFTAGNPFFIYEYLKSALSTGIYALDEETQAWKFHEERIHDADLSSGVAGLVAERIRSLNIVQQSLVSIASVAGHAMSREALKQLFPLLAEHRHLKEGELGSAKWEQTIELAYQELLQKNILSPDLDRFAFFHDKVQEASYSLLTKDELKVLHHAFGLISIQAIKKAGYKVNESLLFEAAYHICKGGRTDLDSDIRAFLIHTANAAKRIFAYDKAKEYLQTLIDSIDAQAGVSLDEKFDALELTADILSISEQVAAAMEIYDQLLTFDCAPLKRIHIYAKKAEYCLNLFDYRNAEKATEAGLKILGESYFKTELGAYLYIIVSAPVLILYSLFFKYFGRQTKEISSEEEDIRFLLRIKTVQTQYFTLPIAAIANHISTTLQLFPYKDNRYRAISMAFWGVVTSTFGFNRLPEACFRHAYNFFDKTANPVDKGFVLFLWGMIFDFPRGNFRGVQSKLEEALSILASVGESFWRSTSLLGLILSDYYGAETGQAGIRSHELIELWKKMRYAPTMLGCAIRHQLEDGNEEQLKFLLQLVHEGDLDLQRQGYDSLDSVLAAMSIGEYQGYIGQYEEAERFAQRAFKISAKRVHRVAYATFSHVLYARALIQNKKPWKALAALAFLWGNQILQVRVFRPHTCFETGRWLFAMDWPRFGRGMIERGIRYANKRGWGTPEAEGRLLLAQHLESIDPALALAHLHLAKEHFQGRHWKFHEGLCEKESNRQKLARAELLNRGSTRNATRTDMNRRGVGLRQQVEVQALMDVLLKLSAINEENALYRALMEALCQASGSELALLYFEENARWSPLVAHNIRIEQNEIFKSKVDQSFIQKALTARPKDPMIRTAQDKQYGQATTTGSALLLPLMSEGKVAGYCYLANTQLYDLFDKRSVEVAQPIATQGAIALQNIRLNKQLAIEKDEISQLHQTLELRVIEQTRDIKSIMQHIGMGICTISSDDIHINKDYSAFLERLLGESELHDKSLLPLLFARTSSTIDEIDQTQQVLFSSLGEMEFMFEVNSHLLPRSLSGKGAEEFALELDWIPICDDEEKVERILITINDVTELRGLQAAAARKDEELRIISEILGNSERAWSRFSASGQLLVKKNQEQLESLRLGGDAVEVLKKVFMNTHTLKGNARSLGLRRMNQVIHEIEQYFADCIRTEPKDTDIAILQTKLQRIEEIFQEYQQVAELKLARSVSKAEAISIPREPILQIYEHLQAQDDQALYEPLSVIRNSLFISMSDLLQQLFREVEAIAVELGKMPPEIHLDLPELRITRPVEEMFRNSLVHLLRNSVDHGLQSGAEREAKGLPARGHISFTAQIRGSMIDFLLEDDGRGLNLKKLKEIGLQKKLISPQEAAEPQNVAGLIFHPDLSTAEKVSDLSGRGIGMTAVKDTIQEASGSIELELLKTRRVEEGFCAFTFVISLPLDLFQIDLQRNAA
ncbi:MAG TPA: AAA family ATPase [Oligoflexus sp.]|uniref:protein kinase domain-containing protein n=1 Tax=Oligoflexus sp. TaxID=1971216 RepID=UPI002D246A38|nr:AAA family ATPase [Oligoflexus sp.]HYX38084.1 AAA family ATPase [Oligoflexus sp.]